jgi:N-acetylmuramoyl-L-alanine amidase
MPDDDRFSPDDDSPIPGEAGNEQDSESEQVKLPASVIFMEMMRRQAARSNPAAEGQPAAPTGHVSPAGSVPPVDDRHSGATPDEAHRRYEAAMQAQHIRRVKRRQARRRTRTVGMLGGFFRTLFIVLAAAGLTATIFSFWTDPKYFKYDVRAELQVALEATAMPTPPWLRRIGIVSGHRGPENDPGAVCPDGLTEREVNFNIAQLVVRNLRGQGYSVDLLDEFDPRLNNYQAAALVSIHSNTCQDFGEYVSGFLVAKASARPDGGEDVRLAECIAQHYAQASGLGRRDTLTTDMTNYHTFREIHPLTPASIIELGFMFNDRPLLTQQPDVLARGITDGILCYLEPGITSEDAVTPEPTLEPTAPSG